MPTQVQFRRGTAAQNDNFKGANGEITIDLTNKSLRVHDGNTSGGFKLATSSELLSVSAIALAAYDQANAANVLAYNTGIGANAYADQVGAGANAYATSIGISSNLYAQTIGTAANTIAIAAFDKANAANVLAYNTGIGANAWSNTKVASVTGTAGQIYSSGGTTPTLNLIATGVSAATYGGASQIPVITIDSFGRLTFAANATVQGMDYAYANSVGVGANTYSNATFIKIISPGQTITGNLAITGSLTVSGNAFSIDTESLRVSDPLIYLAGNNYTSDIVDIGFVANYVNSTGSNVHTGLFRDYTVKEYFLFQGYDQEPVPNHIDITGNNFTLAVLNADIKTSNLSLGGANAITWISSAFAKANAALPNATGTLSGSLTITGDLSVGGNLTIGDASSDTITINGSTISLGNNQTIDSGTLFIDSVNNEVGIGITTPTSNLHVIGTANITSNLAVGRAIYVADGSNVSPSYTFANSGNTGIYRTQNNAIAITISGEDTILISDSDATDNVLFEILNENQESVFTVSANTDGNAFELYDANNASLLLVSVNSSELLVNTALDIQNTATLSTRTLTTTSNVQTELTRFSTTAFTGGRFSLMAKSGANTQMSEMSVLHDGTTAAYTEYGIIYSNNSISLYDVIADVNVGNVRILVTPALNESTTFKVLESKLV